MKRLLTAVIVFASVMMMPLPVGAAPPIRDCRGQSVLQPEPYEHIADENGDGWLCLGRNGRYRDNLTPLPPPG